MLVPRTPVVFCVRIPSVRLGLGEGVGVGDGPPLESRDSRVGLSDGPRLLGA